MGQDQPEYKIDTIATGLSFADGPAWSKDGYLVISDTPTNTILKVTVGKPGTTTFREHSEGSIGNAFDEKGRLYTCESHSRRLTRTDKRGDIEVLADRWQAKRLNAPSDVTVSKRGDVYFTDSAFGSQAAGRELDFNGLYHLTPKGELEVAAKYKTRPSGVALSADGKTLYVALSEDRQVHSFEVDKAGQVSGERVVIKDIPGVPAGLRADAEGNLYIAAKNLVVYSHTGKLIRTVELREKPSNCAFMESDPRTLFVTARTSVYRIQFNLPVDNPAKSSHKSEGAGDP